jgi:isoleucyl-tRNA synthetase
MLKREIVKHYDKYEFHRIYYKLLYFATVDLSHYYLDIMKDRLYTYRKNSNKRRSAQTGINIILTGLIKMIAPILVFTADEVWRKLYPDSASIHLENFPIPKDIYLNNTIFEKWEKLNIIRDEVLKAIEIERKNGIIGNSVEAMVEIYSCKSDYNNIIKEYEKELPLLFIVSQVKLLKEPLNDSILKSENTKIIVNVRNAIGEKCERCWLYSESVGTNNKHSTLCDKCIDAVTHLEE